MKESEALEMVLDALNIDRMINPEDYSDEPYKAAANLFSASQVNLDNAINCQRGKDVSGHIKNSTALVAAKAIRLLIDLE